MKKLIALVGIALIAGSAAAADSQKIVIAKVEVQKTVIAKAEVKAPVKRVATASTQKPQDDSRFDNYQLEAFACCGLPE
jgi:hypothetical protein